MIDIIQASYGALEKIAGQFGQQSEAVAGMLQAVRGAMEPLEGGGWVGRGSNAFFAEMHDVIFPTLNRLNQALQEGDQTTRQIIDVMQAAEKEAAEPFKGDAATHGQLDHVGKGQLLYAKAGLQTIPTGPPPVPVPGSPFNEWKWNPNPQNDRGGTWGPKEPLPGQSQPSASWDPEGHWDVDDGKRTRQRYDENGKPISAEEAHGKKKESEPTKFEVSSDFLEKAAAITGLTGAALIIYLIISEGSRILFPPRNLIPLP